MTRDMAALHADLRLFGAAIVGGDRTVVVCYTLASDEVRVLFHTYRTTRMDSGTLTKERA